MKKMFLFLGAASVIGVGSAFTSAMMTPPTGTHVQVSPGVWEPISNFPNLDCSSSPQVCSYTQTGDEPGEMGDPLKNPDNFDIADRGTPILNP